MATPCACSSSTDKSSDSAKNATPEPWKSPELSSKILPQDLKIEAEGVEDSNNLRIQHFNGAKKRSRIDTDPVHDCMVDSESSKPESKPVEPANKKKKGNDNVEDAVSGWSQGWIKGEKESISTQTSLKLRIMAQIKEIAENPEIVIVESHVEGDSEDGVNNDEPLVTPPQPITNRRVTGDESSNDQQATTTTTLVMPPEFTAAFGMMAQIMQNQQWLQQEQENRQRQQMTGSKTHYKNLKKANMPVFDGGLDPEKAEKWLHELEANFDVLEVPEDVKPKVVIPFLVGDAGMWWKGTAPAYTREGQPLDWQTFKSVFLKHYFPDSIRSEKQRQFFNLKQTENMSVMEYAGKFNALGRYVPTVMADDSIKLLSFEEGLQGCIRARLSSVPSNSYEDSFNRCIGIEADIKRGDAERGAKRSRPMSNQGTGFGACQ